MTESKRNYETLQTMNLLRSTQLFCVFPLPPLQLIYGSNFRGLNAACAPAPIHCCQPGNRNKAGALCLALPLTAPLPEGRLRNTEGPAAPAFATLSATRVYNGTAFLHTDYTHAHTCIPQDHGMNWVGKDL